MPSLISSSKLDYFVNDHRIQTVEDILMVFEPDRYLWKYRNAVTQNMAIWEMNRYNSDEPWFELLFTLNQDNMYEINYKMTNEKDRYESVKEQGVMDTLVLLRDWFRLNRPEREFDITLQPIQPITYRL